MARGKWARLSSAPAHGSPNLAYLLDGYRRFRNHGWKPEPERWENLSEGQQPRVMVIASSDSLAERAMEQGGARVSLAYLRTFPCVQAKEGRGDLKLADAFFAISDGLLHLRDEEAGAFRLAA